MRKAMLLLAILGLAGSLWAATPQLGTWKLNIAQSKFSPSYPAPKELTFVFQAVGDQIEWVLTGTNASGSPISTKATYPQEGGVVKWVVPPLGPADSTTIATVITPYELYGTILKDGKQQQVDHIVISKDGRTTHETVKGKNSQGRPFEVLLVFDKQ
ncbi:MAG: hypothetical protein WBQ34_00030 [Candidatus Acidiferrales bacterium]